MALYIPKFNKVNLLILFSFVFVMEVANCLSGRINYPVRRYFGNRNGNNNNGNVPVGPVLLKKANDVNTNKDVNMNMNGQDRNSNKPPSLEDTFQQLRQAGHGDTSNIREDPAPKEPAYDSNINSSAMKGTNEMSNSHNSNDLKSNNNFNSGVRPSGNFGSNNRTYYQGNKDGRDNDDDNLMREEQYAPNNYSHMRNDYSDIPISNNIPIERNYHNYNAADNSSNSDSRFMRDPQLGLVEWGNSSGQEGYYNTQNSNQMQGTSQPSAPVLGDMYAPPVMMNPAFVQNQGFGDMIKSVGGKVLKAVAQTITASPPAEASQAAAIGGETNEPTGGQDTTSLQIALLQKGIEALAAKASLLQTSVQDENETAKNSKHAIVRKNRKLFGKAVSAVTQSVVDSIKSKNFY